MKNLDNNIEDLKKQQYRYILIAISMVFLAILTYTIVWEINYNNNFDYFRDVEAIVIDHKTIEGVEYDVINYVVDDLNFTKVTPYESKNEINDKIIVYYDSNNPIGVIFNLDSTRIILPIVSIVFGVSTMGLYIVYFLTYNKKILSRASKRNKIRYIYNSTIYTNNIIK